MMRIHERVLLVGSGKYGFEMTDAMDCNVFLLDAGGEYALIDAGGGVDPDRITDRIESAGIPMSRVSHLLLTHVHGDHAAGALYFRDKYGMRVVLSQEASPWLEIGDMDKTSLNAAKRAGVYPEGFRFPACPVDRTVIEKDKLRIGDLELNVFETPGHSRGHVSYMLEDGGKRLLFAGDTVFAGGKIVLQRIWDCFIEEYAQTIEKLHALHIDGLFPGHGPYLLSGAWKHIGAADAAFKRLELPPNL
jgi:glyoxylase-like metal-dependent hydrolase (beta-lactamase superfamily II)